MAPLPPPPPVGGFFINTNAGTVWCDIYGKGTTGPVTPPRPDTGMFTVEFVPDPLWRWP